MTPNQMTGSQFINWMNTNDAKWNDLISADDIAKLMEIQGRVSAADLEHLEKIAQAREKAAKIEGLEMAAALCEARGIGPDTPAAIRLLKGTL